MKIHLICDPDWSTGVIAKDLIALMPDKDLRIHSWSNYTEFPDSDLLICFTLTTGARWFTTRRRNSIHLCNGPLELQLPEVQSAMALGSNLFFGGVSKECCQGVQKFAPGSYAHLLPASARAGRFQRRSRPGKRIAGFVGHPYPLNIQVSGPVKRPDWFFAICERHNLVPRFSNADYTYETMQEFYDGVDYLFCTSSSEGGPLGPFEAALCGVPVISTKVGFWGECNMGGYFSTIDDPEIDRSLARASELADEQFAKMQSVCMESMVPIWRSAIDLVTSGL